jgi:hypothetical protein
MARRTSGVIDVTEILMHWNSGRSKNELAGCLGVGRKTLRKCIAPAEAAGSFAGGPARSEGEWAELVRGWFPQLADTQSTIRGEPEGCGGSSGCHHGF